MPMVEFQRKKPILSRDCWVAPSALLIGDVVLASGSSVWFDAILRGDGASIKVGNDSNIQEGVVIHPDRSAAFIGQRVTIGHRATLEGVYIDDEVLVGIGALVLEDTKIGRGSLIAAGSVVPSGLSIPPGSLVMGNPARVVGETEPKHQKLIQEGWHHYSELKEEYRQLPSFDVKRF
jgi:carbonic anhydrase/acetyltransferase-like protein (isoleucine patch superfamily)